MNHVGLFIKKERMKQNMSQEALAEGICSNTYLSKIESGFERANEEILKLLTEALGYTYNIENDDQFIEMSESIWDRLFMFELNTEDFTEDISFLLENMRYSKHSMDVYLLEVLIDYFIEHNINQSLYDLDVGKLTHKQLHRYYCIVSLYNNNADLKDQKLIHFDDTIGFISYYKTQQLFLNGKYRQAIQQAEKTYRIFSDNGNIMGMINISFLESSSYSNLYDNETHVKISKRIHHLNRYAKKEDVEFFIHYNLGSSYLVQRDYELAKNHLSKCLDTSLQESYEMVYEKFVLLYVFTQEKEQALIYLNKMNPKNLNSYNFLKCLYEQNGDVTNKQCVLLLEQCYEFEKNKHHGRMMLFGALLYNAYRSTYQYPKAIKILETLNLNEMPLFFEK